MRAKQIQNAAGSSDTIAVGNSEAINIGIDNYVGTPISIQIYAGSTPTGKLQGVIAIDDADFADASTLWGDIEDGAFTADGFLHLYAYFTHIRIVMSVGSCEARLVY